MKIYQVVISAFISLATMSSAFARNCEFPSVPPPTGYVCDAGGFLVKDPFAQPSQPELGYIHRWTCTDIQGKINVDLYDSNWVSAGRGESGDAIVSIHQLGQQKVIHIGGAYRGYTDFNETYFVSSQPKFQILPSTYGQGPGAANGTLYFSENSPQFLLSAEFVCEKLVSDQ